jgi:hypothetical protein
LYANDDYIPSDQVLVWEAGCRKGMTFRAWSQYAKFSFNSSICMADNVQEVTKLSAPDIYFLYSHYESDLIYCV